jgi:cysteine sulfinate desulfinase/cysteine desulfurase-like protein
METAVANSVEPGDVILVGVMGYFGERLVEMAKRYGGDVRTIEKPWGDVFTPDDIRTGLEAYKPAVLMLVHAETSTGALQPLAGLGDLCHQHNCLLLTDCVTSLGAAPLLVDEWGIDVAYSCSQKGLGCPPGASPLTYGRIQDIHVTSGLIERWLGLGTVAVQTASGAAGETLSIVGLHNFLEVRDFLYERMRGVKDHPASTAAASNAKVLEEIRDELVRARNAVERAP